MSEDESNLLRFNPVVLHLLRADCFYPLRKRDEPEQQCTSQSTRLHKQTNHQITKRRERGSSRNKRIEILCQKRLRHLENVWVGVGEAFGLDTLEVPPPGRRVGHVRGLRLAVTTGQHAVNTTIDVGDN